MKKHLLFVMAALVSVSILTSCSDNGDDPKMPELEEATYTDAAGLTLTLDGVAMPGKTVKMDPIEGTDKAKLTISSSFNLGDIPGYQTGMLEGDHIQGPGVLPGSPVTELEVTLDAKDGKYTFSGSDESEYCTFSYRGEINDGNLNLTIEDVKLKNTKFAGTTWKLNQVNEEDATQGPAHLVWEPYNLMDPDASAAIDLGVMKFPLQTLLQYVAVLPLLENPADPEGELWSVGNMLNYLLTSVTFLEDGNIIAEYRDLERGETITTSPKNLVQYVVKSDSEMLVFLNPQAIMAADQSRALDIASIINQVTASVIPMLAGGVPVGYTMNGNEMSVYLGTNVILPLLKSIIVPIVNDEETVAMLIGMIAGNEGMAEYLPMMEAAIASLPTALEMTTKIEIGLNFTKK